MATHEAPIYHQEREKHLLAATVVQEREDELGRARATERDRGYELASRRPASNRQRKAVHGWREEDQWWRDRVGRR